MADRRHICVFDFETGGRNPHKCEIIQIGACILHRANFKILDRFESLMKPEDFEALSDESLKINGITREQLMEAPETSVVFPSWAAWIKKWNTSRDRSFFGAPIACGYNITGFDLILLNRYCQKFKYWDEKGDRQTLMYPLNHLDVFQHIWLYTRTNADVKSLKLTNVLQYMGIDEKEITEGAHQAMWDVEFTAKIAVKFLEFARELTQVNEITGKRRLEIKNSLVEHTNNG